MPIPDLINGTLELFAGLFVLNHCRHILKDKQVAGVSTVSACFFTFWGFWNLFYYPHLDQWISFAGGLFIVAANVLWVILLIRYRKPHSQGGSS
jgi:hypothetical protein